MNLDISSEENLIFFEALASPVRIKIIKCLSKKNMNIKELADEIGVSSAIMTTHIRKMEEAGLVESRKSKAFGKVCKLIEKTYNLVFPVIHVPMNYYDLNLKLGQYTEACVEPTCGIATEESVIGSFDEPKYFFDSRRDETQLLWFSKGFVEYRIPNYIPQNCRATSIEICVEMSSEYSHIDNAGQSDIILYLNDEELCLWTSPGDFGDRRGRYTPNWWRSGQYGILKRYEINEKGVYLDKVLKSEKTLEDYKLERQSWTLRFEVCDKYRKAGGLTIFGEKFGDYAQDIYVCVRYD
ncbi:helix-turn-helix domain-containing protein [Anaerocolumna sedimenticola]|uniref:Helix-turn-helix domain-containing protein n=1 Tax=Anaerocolumna sedimenticola TaxID=2696063 RepID=A0A6P1THP3_9FIRM|nr:ArsR family transcriptional regulator [Anaerocolumna sedimenticola]QHQ59551.1 helix-turn-helix domain-containing protein [Anaerocolumna sedimenticola]